MNEVLVAASDSVILAIVVLWIGNLITSRVEVLRRYSIPVAVTGGLLCSIIVAIINSTTDNNQVRYATSGYLVAFFLFHDRHLGENFAFEGRWQSSRHPNDLRFSSF